MKSESVIWPGPRETQPERWKRAGSFTRRLHLRAHPFPLYLRFGALPRGDRSRVWWTDSSGRRFERGPSCFRARQEAEGLYAVEARTPELLGMGRLLRNEARDAFSAASERPEGTAAQYVDRADAEGLVCGRLRRGRRDERDPARRLPGRTHLQHRSGKVLISWDRICLAELVAG